MKKFLTLVLVLVLALGLTVPAMAFTSDTSEDVDHPYDLKIYLVEYDDNDLFGLVALPESDRGYAKNEIVAAVVELEVPEDEIILNGEYAHLVFGGDNVDLDVADNYGTGHVISLQTNDSVDDLTAADYTLATALNADDEISITIGSHGDLDSGFQGDETYKWLFFAKVTDDEASLYAKLIDGDGSVGFASVSGLQTLLVTLDGEDYTITKHGVGDDGGYYLISYDDDGDTVGIYLFVDDDNVTEGMAIDLDIGTNEDDEDATALGVNTDNELGIVEGAIVDTGDDAEDYLDIYQDVVVDVFGLDYFKIGNYLRDSFFEDLVSADTIIATVDIEPWTAYVTVPDNIVVDPPKTGDAASIMGFVMVALSGAGVVALRKRG